MCGLDGGVVEGCVEVVGVGVFVCWRVVVASVVVWDAWRADSALLGEDGVGFDG